MINAREYTVNNSVGIPMMTGFSLLALILYPSDDGYKLTAHAPDSRTVMRATAGTRI